MRASATALRAARRSAGDTAGSPGTGLESRGDSDSVAGPAGESSRPQLEDVAVTTHKEPISMRILMATFLVSEPAVLATTR